MNDPLSAIGYVDKSFKLIRILRWIYYRTKLYRPKKEEHGFYSAFLSSGIRDLSAPRVQTAEPKSDSKRGGRCSRCNKSVGHDNRTVVTVQALQEIERPRYFHSDCIDTTNEVFPMWQREFWSKKSPRLRIASLANLWKMRGKPSRLETDEAKLLILRVSDPDGLIYLLSCVGKIEEDLPLEDKYQPQESDLAKMREAFSTGQAKEFWTPKFYETLTKEKLSKNKYASIVQYKPIMAVLVTPRELTHLPRFLTEKHPVRATTIFPDGHLETKTFNPA